LSVLRVAELPDGWLGENHAFAFGAAETRGDWLLFTDADVRFAPECFRKALGYTTRNGAHHLTLAPEILSRGAFLGGFVATFEFICFPIRQKSQAGISDDSRRGLPGGGAVAVIAYTCPRRPVPLLLPLPISSSTPPRSWATRVLRNEPRVSGALQARE
jgi:hypothetical protein